MNTFQVEELVKAALRTQELCVLATSAEKKPHCSLMAFVCDESCRSIYMVTHSNTKKYGNLMENDEVSLLVDTRTKESSRGQITALTVNGKFCGQISGEELVACKNEFLSRHSHLKDFVSHGSAVFFKVNIDSIQVMSSATDAFYLDFNESEK